MFVLFHFRSKSPETSTEGIYLTRILELFCETFHYSFDKLENKLPMVIFTHSIQNKNAF